jgi:hypothetical protein
MICRIGFLSVALVLSGGVVAWLVQESSLTAQVPGVRPVIVEEVVPPEILAAKSIPAPPAHRAEGVFDFRVLNESEQKIQSAFGNPVEIDFIDTPLQDAMEFLADAHDITILIDESALTEEGVAIDEPLNRTLSGIKLDSALNIMLEPLGLTHMIEDEVLKITTIIDAQERRTARIYNTGYLKQIGIEPEALAKTIQATVQPDQWRQSAPPVEVAQAAEKEAVVSRDDQGTIRVWNTQTGRPGFHIPVAAQLGGATPKKVPLSSMEVLGDMLVVSAPKSVHDEIQAVLVQLDRRWATEHGQR